MKYLPFTALSAYDRSSIGPHICVHSRILAVPLISSCLVRIVPIRCWHGAHYVKVDEKSERHCLASIILLACAMPLLRGELSYSSSHRLCLLRTLITRIQGLKCRESIRDEFMHLVIGGSGHDEPAPVLSSIAEGPHPIAVHRTAEPCMTCQKSLGISLIL